MGVLSLTPPVSYRLGASDVIRSPVQTAQAVSSSGACSSPFPRTLKINRRFCESNSCAIRRICETRNVTKTNTMTAFQSSQVAAIRADRTERLQTFKQTGATAEIGVLSNWAGVFTMNTLNGTNARNWDNKPFASEIEAVRAYAKANFSKGTLKRTAAGTYLVYVFS